MIRVPHHRTLRTAAALGVDASLGERERTQHMELLAPIAQRLRTELLAGGVALIVGPSGAGKSSLLKLLAPGAVTVVPLVASQTGRAVAELAPRLGLCRWMGLLSCFGLAEARILLTPAGRLSAGERARLELALAAARCIASVGAPPTLVADELCSVLDRPTAASVALGAARWARRSGVRLVGATAHDDLLPVFAPDVVIRLRLGECGPGGVEWTRFGLNAAG